MKNLQEAKPRRNIEIKARCADLLVAEARLRGMGVTERQSVDQCDTYFKAPVGRLKIREASGQAAQLLGYERGNERESRESRYYLVEAGNAENMIAMLGAAMGIRGRVRKHREIFIWGGVRIHLDDVEGLGKFLEIEAVISGTLEEKEAYAKVGQLKKILGISDGDLIGESYSDLLGI